MYGGMTTAFPAPATYLPSSVRRGAIDQPTDPFAIPNNQPRDSRVQWAQRTEATLKQEKQPVTNEMNRNRDLYDGKQWTGQRAPWKNQSVVNYAAWCADHWMATLSDNKPKPTWEAHNPIDQWQADIMTVSYNQDAADFGYQQAQEDAILCSRIGKVAYIYQTFDPFARRVDGMGGIVFRCIDGIDVYTDKDCRQLQSANIAMIERREPIGDILFRYPHLQRKLNVQGNDLQSQNGSGPVNPAPPQSLFTNQGTQHVPPYYAPSAKMSNDGGTGGNKVLEFFTFPRGPDAQTEVARIRFTADGRVAFKRKMIRYDDGTEEPLQRVITEGGIIYELPMSTATTAKYAAEAYGGLEILQISDALDVQHERQVVPLYPAGRRTVVIGDHVADDGRNPFAHGRIPLAPYHAYRRGNGFFGYSDIDRIASQQEYLNRLYALLIDAAILTSNPTWLIPTDAQIADEDITNAPGAIIRGDGMMLKMARREPGPSMPQYVMSLLQFTIQQIREISGLSESSTGGKFKGQVAAETVSMYQEQAGIRFRQGQRNVEAAEVELGLQYQCNVAQFYTEPRLVKLKDAAGIEQPITFIGMDLGAPMRVMVKPGSQLPQSPSARLNLVMSLITSPIPAFDLPTFWRHLQEVGIIDSATEMENRMRRYMDNPKDLWLAPALLQMLTGGQKKNNKGGGKKTGGGKSVKNATPAAAAGNAAA